MPDQKQEAILAAALQLFTERTFAGAAVPPIAERAGVATGTIYRYFPSKEALLNAVYQQWKGELKRLLLDEQPDPDERTPREEFHHWWTALARFVHDHPTAFEFLELHHHEPYLDSESRAIALEVDAGALAFTARGQQEGVVRTDVTPQVLIALVYGALTGIFRGTRLHPDLFSPDDLANAEDAVWDMVRATGETPTATTGPNARTSTTLTTTPRPRTARATRSSRSTS